MGLSLTINHHLIVTLQNTKRISEYTTEGRLVREISLDDSIDWPCICVELSTGQFVVSHAGSTQHRVPIVDTSGCIIKSYGGPQGGSSAGQLNDPYDLAVDSSDNILVADQSSNK